MKEEDIKFIIKIEGFDNDIALSKEEYDSFIKLKDPIGLDIDGKLFFLERERYNLLKQGENEFIKKQESKPEVVYKIEDSGEINIYNVPKNHPNIKK